jgi:hypothetical protein
VRYCAERISPDEEPAYCEIPDFYRSDWHGEWFLEKVCSKENNFDRIYRMNRQKVIFTLFSGVFNLTPYPPLLVRRGGNSLLAMFLPSPG